MMDFHKALDDAQAAVDKNPEAYVFNRERLEAEAKENTNTPENKPQISLRNIL